MSNPTKDSENILTVDELKKSLEQRRRLPSRRRLTQLRDWSDEKQEFFLERQKHVWELLEKIGAVRTGVIYCPKDGSAPYYVSQDARTRAAADECFRQRVKKNA
ncbi:hypothetical protein [Cloacibacillus evryensis]|uniref:hypothetical protein n=1 Tax=Cloacibacillus evryensis TaxID=508460 RepID=UPI00210DE9B2|nr:hypothetical protein [Cloacibacillus evryensis]MCQ4763268.1 hypothetical protein [Cloacibacillus evryensis]